MDTIGERIIFLRENLDLSQVKLAALIGITKMTLYKYEKNICEPRGEIIARLADALNTTADFLLGRTQSSAPLAGQNPEGEFQKKRENDLMRHFRHLSSDNQAKIEERIAILLESQTNS